MGEATVSDPVTVDFESRTFSLIPVNVGNPPAVAFLEDHAGVEALGEFLNADRSLFKEGVNLEFCVVTEDGIDVVGFERGVGLTRACGTGAVAVAAAAWQSGVVDDQPVAIRLPGGKLEIARSGEQLVMTGPVNATFAGTFSDSFAERFTKEDV